MSEIGNSVSKKCNQDELFPLHLYQDAQLKHSERKQRLLDENLHDQQLPTTILQQAKQALKIGEDTHFQTPIDKFGSKILQTLGWKEGFGIGKDSQVQNAPIEYIPRQYRLGLGAKALTSEQITTKRQLTVTDNYDASSIGKNIKRIGEELKVKKELTIGSKVEIMGGTHKGLQGQIVAMKKPSSLGQEDPSEQYISVQLSKSESVVQVKRRRLELKRERSISRSRSPKTKNAVEETKSKVKSLKWICEGVVVRCVSRSAYSGKLYGKELEVITVLDDNKFEVKLDDKVYSDFCERDFETVLPTSKQLALQQHLQVMIVRGPNRGQTGKVLEIDKKHDKVHVQVDITMVKLLGQDDVCCLQQQE